MRLGGSRPSRTEFVTSIDTPSAVVGRLSPSLDRSSTLLRKPSLLLGGSRPKRSERSEATRAHEGGLVRAIDPTVAHFTDAVVDALAAVAFAVFGSDVGQGAG